MVVVDTSVWVDFLNGRRCRQTDLLDDLLTGEFVLTGDLIVAEVLQGIRTDAGYQRTLDALNGLPYTDMLGRDVAVSSAANFRTLRQKGVTIRKTIDVMIATFCVHNGLPLLHRDRDFDAMAAHIGLRTL